MNNLLNKLILGSSATALLAAAPLGAALAQGNGEIEQVVVSASRITIAGYTQPTPVTVIGAAQLEEGAYSNITDAVRQLPQVNIAASNLSVNSGNLSPTAGTNLLNLRSLSTIRTLTLFDGQRVVWSSLLNGGVDVTTFPTALIQRVDVVTGGASAAWGSDAIAGVVNFVLNKNFNGLKATIEAGDTHDNLRRNLTLNGAWGDDIFGGRGHLEFAVEAKFNPDSILLTQEHWFKGAYWVSNPAFAPGNGQPQLIVGTNVGLANATPGGIINSSPAGVAGPGVVAASANALRGIEFVGGGTPQLVNYGNLTLGSLSNGGSLTTADGEWAAQSLSQTSNTYTLFGYGRYKLTDHIQASVQLNYSYFTGKSGGGTTIQTSLVIKSDNAYIPASVRSAMQNGGITSFTLGTLDLNNFNTRTVTGATFFSQSAGGMQIVNYVRRYLQRGVFTLEGTLGDDWSWNAYVQHSDVHNWSITPNNPILANLSAAEDAVTVTSANVGKTGLALGSIACRTTVTGTPFVLSSNNGTAQTGCVPLDVFGEGVASPAALAYIGGASTMLTGANAAQYANSQYVSHQTFQQEVFEASMQGTLPWALPAGKVAVAFGGGYRKESAIAHSPLFPGLTANAYGKGNGALNFPGDQDNLPPASYNVMEGFAELDAPILKNNIVNSLDVSMAGRITGYSTSGQVETWKLGATSQVNDDIRLRTTWSVDIRAPQLYELFNPGSFSTSTMRDPKTQANVQAINHATGNPNVVPEVAHTISGGVVLTPTFIPGLTVSVDWYSINVTGEITAINATTLLTQCNASLPSAINPGQSGNPNDPLCKLLEFNGPGGALSVVNTPVINFSGQTVSGLDLSANYSMDFWEGTLNLATNDSYQDENTVCTPGAGCVDNAGGGQLGANAQTGPKWKGLVSANYAAGPYSVTVQTRWWGTGVTQPNGNTGNQATAATANLYDPAHYEMPALAYLDLRASYKWNDNISLYGAVDDALNTPPPLDPSTQDQNTPGQQLMGTMTNPYDLFGRVFRVGIRLNY